MLHLQVQSCLFNHPPCWEEDEGQHMAIGLWFMCFAMWSFLSVMSSCSGLKVLSFFPSGSHGSLSESGSQSSGEGGDSHPGNQKQSVPRSRAATVSTEYGPHPQLVERQRQQWQSLDPVSIRLDDQSASRRTQQPLQRSGVHAAPPYRFKPANKNEGRPPPPYPGISRATVTPAPPLSSLRAKSSAPPSYSHSQQRQLGHLGPQRQCPPAPLTPIDTFRSPGMEWQDWQRERWQIWQLLSSDNADTLPETLVWARHASRSCGTQCPLVEQWLFSCTLQDQMNKTPVSLFFIHLVIAVLYCKKCLLQLIFLFCLNRKSTSNETHESIKY